MKHCVSSAVDATRFIKGRFRGVEFLVEATSDSGGRRVAVHEFVLNNDPFVEDLGGKPQRLQVTAYQFNSADDNALWTAGHFGRGPGQLILPWHAPMTAQLIDIRRNTKRDRLNRVGYNLTFVEVNAQPVVARVNGRRLLRSRVGRCTTQNGVPTYSGFYMVLNDYCANQMRNT